MNTFELDQVIKKRGDTFTLGPVSINLVPGEILGVMGPNGAGKTTLLRMLWGFVRPDEGRVSVLDRTPHLEQIWVRMQAGYMTESPAFYEWMTGIRFLEFMAGFYPTWDWEHAYRLIDRFELDAEKKVSALSKGNRVKLGLIAAVTHHPRLLILDEPTSGLDPVARIDILETLRQIAVEDETGIVLSSHISDDLDRIAHTALILNGGRVVESGPTHILLERYSRTRLEEVFLHAIGRLPAVGMAHHA
jgi:ABC-2 type transport system ATP-binding protein